MISTRSRQLLVAAWRIQLLVAAFLLVSTVSWAATLVSCADGNFTAAGTWCTAAATSENDSNAANTALTSSYVTSSTFTPGAMPDANITLPEAPE